MRRHARLKGYTDGMCAFCASRLRSSIKPAHLSPTSAVASQRRGFRATAIDSQRPTESQAWDDGPDLAFQPSLHAAGLEEQARARLQREKELREEEARTAERTRLAREREAANRVFTTNSLKPTKARSPSAPKVLITKHFASRDNHSANQARESEGSAGHSESNKIGRPGLSSLSIFRSNIDRRDLDRATPAKLSLSRPSKVDSELTLLEEWPTQAVTIDSDPARQGQARSVGPYDEEQRALALSDIARQIGQNGLPPLDGPEPRSKAPKVPGSVFPAVQSDLQPRQAADESFWRDNDAWNHGDGSVLAVPPDLRLKVDQQKARLEEHQRLEAEKKKKDIEAQRKADHAAEQARAGVNVRAERQRSHALLLERQKLLAEQRKLNEKRSFSRREAFKMAGIQEDANPEEQSGDQVLPCSNLHTNRSPSSDLSSAEEELLAKLLARKKSQHGSSATSESHLPPEQVLGEYDKTPTPQDGDKTAAGLTQSVSSAQTKKADQVSDATEIPPFDPSVTSQWKLFQHQGQKDQKAGTTANQEIDTNSARSNIRARIPTKQHAKQMDDANYSQMMFSESESTPRSRFGRKDNRECRICGQVGHIAIDCTENVRGRAKHRIVGGRQNMTNDQDVTPNQDPSRRTSRSSQDALSSLEAEFEAEEESHTARRSRRQTSTPVSTKQQPPNTFNTTRSEISSSVAIPRTSLEGPDSEPQFTSRARKFTEPMESERSERKPRRRVQDDEEDVNEDFGDRKRGGRRSHLRANEDEDAEDKPRRSRRRERDLDEESLDEMSGLKRIRDRRQKDRDDRRQRARDAERRKTALNAKRSEALSKIVLPQFITVSNLAQALGVKLDKFTRKMESLGFNNTAHDHVLSADNASLIALEFDFDPSIGSELEVASRDLVPRPLAEDQSSLPTRPPIVTIMGHVDHGKTTILDYLRKSSVAASEHGGITQHIGAFSVRMSGGKLITFLDTPGHAAFLSMRKRGANVTDIVILVVAADDSVKPQTLEAMKHAREANVPIIVAVNKVDKPEADVQRVKQDLARHGIEIEDYGGDVQVVPVSGKTGQGMDDLEEAVVTLGEILDNRSEDNGFVEGWVLEATTKAAGRVATVLVRRGTLKPGSIIVAGQTWTRVRSLQNEAGVSVNSAGPGTPVEVDGWRDQPVAGDMVLETDTEQRATQVVNYRVELSGRQKLAEDVEAINEARRLEQEKRDREKSEAEARESNQTPTADATKDQNASSTGRKEVAFIIKADVSGSAEAVENYLQQLMNPVCAPRLLRTGVGPVSEFDIEHASAAGGHVITFNLPTPAGDIASLAAYKEVKIVEQNVIYRLLEQVKSILEDQLEPTKIQRVTGEAQVLKPFDIGIGGRKKLRIAGSKVQNGQIKRNSRVRVLRNGKKIYDGEITSLKNVKKDVTEMRKGTECGIGFDEWSDAQEGDQIQAYEEITEKRTLPI